jgi:hypothetical protein
LKVNKPNFFTILKLFIFENEKQQKIKNRRFVDRNDINMGCVLLFISFIIESDSFNFFNFKS